jgi:hypothetical protein
MSRENVEVGRAVWVKSKPIPTRPTPPLLIRLGIAFPFIGRAVLAFSVGLPHGRVRREFVEFVMREAVVGSFNRRQLDAGRSLVTPDFRAWPAEHVGTLLGIPREGVAGYDEFRRFLSDWVDFWGEFSIEPRRVVDLGSSMLLLNHMRGHGPGSGIELDGQEEAQLYELEGGRVARFRQFWSWREGLEAVGLSE